MLGLFKEKKKKRPAWLEHKEQGGRKAWEMTEEEPGGAVLRTGESH